MKPHPIQYRKATILDLPKIAHLTDYWLAGRGIPDKAHGVVDDYFIPRGRHQAMIARYTVLLAIDTQHLVGWAVKDDKDVLIHTLVAGDARHQGIGSNLLVLLDPAKVRVKLDQSTGNPSSFYLERGYQPACPQPRTPNQNVLLLEKT